MKTCKHFRYQIPEDEANYLRLSDNEPCFVCDTKPRHILCEDTNQMVFIPQFPTPKNNDDHRVHSIMSSLARK